jgi:hypothetical protein
VALGLGLAEAVQQGAVGQLHRDDEEVADLPGPEHRKQVGVPDELHGGQGAHLDAARLVPQPDELQGQMEAAGADGTPDLAEAAASQQSDQFVIGEGSRPRREDDAGLRRWGRRVCVVVQSGC